MKSKINYYYIGILLALLAVAIMGYIEQYIAPSYWVKTSFKLFLFLGTITLYCFISKEKVKDIIRLNSLKNAKVLYTFVIGAFVGIIVLFLLFRNNMDLVGIKEGLMTKEKLTKNNCWYIFTYVMIVNSFLEEAFFRGFIFSLFDRLNRRKLGYIITGLLFAYYHIGMVSGWFNIWLFVFCIAGLAIVSMILQYISCYYNSLKASWIIHGFANLAINTIGIILLFCY